MSSIPAAARGDQSNGGAAVPSNHPCYACRVRGLGLCAPLELRELDLLNAIASRVRLAAEQVVFCEGDEAECVFAVTDGTVRLSKMLPDGRRQVTGFLSPGGFLGIAYSDTYAYSAEAVTPLALCRFPRRRLEALLYEMPSLERRLLSIASNELKAAQDQMLLLGRKSAEEKISTFLWHWCLRSRQDCKPDCVIDLPMNRTDIADYLGLTTETVSRTLSRFAKDGLLAIPSTHKVRLCKPELIEELALEVL
jgi:CRP/FNR family transcriptional regulator